MAAVILSKAYGASCYAYPGKLYAVSLAARGTVTVSASVSIVADGANDYQQRLLNEPSVDASLPNQFYGIAEYAPISLEFANLDGDLTHLLEDDERSSFVRIRRYNPVTQSIEEVATGVIDQFQVGDTTTLTIVPHDFAKLSDPFPRNLVTTTEFSTATDTGAPVPVFFGEGADSPCPYVGADDVNQNYDYLVGEDALDVFSVKKNGAPAFVQPLSFTTIWVSGIVPASIQPTQFFTSPDDPYQPGTYTGFFMKGLAGSIRNTVYRIVAHEPPPPQYDPSTNGAMFFDTSRLATDGYVAWAGIFDGIAGTTPSVNAGNVTVQTSNAGVWGVATNTIDVTHTVVVLISADHTPSAVSGDSSLLTPFTRIFQAGARTLQGGGLNINLGVYAARAIDSGVAGITVGMTAPAKGCMRVMWFGRVAGPDHVEGTGYIQPGTNSTAPWLKWAQINGQRTKSVHSVLLAAAAWGVTPAVAISPSTTFDAYPIGHLRDYQTQMADIGEADGFTFITGYLSTVAKIRLNTAKSVITVDKTLTQTEANSLVIGVPQAQIQEHDVLINSEDYPRRTALRFGRRQNDGNSAIQIAASARRYRQSRINMLVASERLDDSRDWVLGGILGPIVTPIALSGRSIDRGTSAGPAGTLGPTTFLIDANRRFGALVWDLTWFLTQRSIRPKNPNAPSYTLSFWYYATDPSATSVAGVLLSRDALAQSVSTTINLTAAAPVWRQVVLTLVPNTFPVGTLQVQFIGQVSAGVTQPFCSTPGAFFQIGFLQLEEGSTFTVYEATGPSGPWPTGTFSWTAADAIRDLLSNGRWGINQPVDAEGFEAAARALLPPAGTTASLQPWQVAIGGVLPGPHGEQPVLKDILDELTRTRGMILSRRGAAWTIDVDQPGSSIDAVLGTEETPYKNILSYQTAQKPSVADSMSTLRMLFDPRLGLFAGQAEAFYSGGVDRTVGTVGVLKEFDSKLIKAANAADRAGAYIAAYAPAQDRPITVEAGDEARSLRPGSLINLFAPRLQPQNLIPYSERDATPDGWVETREGTGATPSILRSVALGPFGNTYTACRIGFGAGGSGRSLTYSGKKSPTSLPGPMMKAFGRVWLKWADATTPGICELLLRDAQSNGGTASYSLTVDVGRSWKAYQFEQGIRPMDAVEGMYFGISNPAGEPAKNIYAWGAQLCFDWQRGYVKTKGTAVDPTYVYKCTSVSIARDKVSLTAIPYDAAVLFAPYTPGAIFLPRVPDDLTTSTFAIVPDDVTDLQLPPATGSGADTGAWGTNYWAEIRFVMPMHNAAGVRVQFQKGGEGALTGGGWTDVATVHSPFAPGQESPSALGRDPINTGAPGTPVMVVARGLVPNTTYYVRVVSFDTMGRYSRLDESRSFTIPA